MTAFNLKIETAEQTRPQALRPARVLVLSSEFPPGPGGIGTHAYQLARQWHVRGREVAVISPQDHAPEEQVRLFQSGVPFHFCRVASGRSPVVELYHRTRAVKSLVARFHPDVALASGKSGVWLGAFLFPRLGLPWLAVAHGSELSLPGRFAALLTRHAFQQANAVVAVSQFTVRLLRNARIQPRDVAVVHNGADEQCFGLLPEAEVAEFRRGLPYKAKHVILTVGQVTERKGQEVVIRAMPQVLKELPDTHYLLAGLPTLQPHLAKVAQEMGVSARVHFLGCVPAPTLVRYLNCCDLFAMTSRTTSDGDCEGFGIAVIEAALCGKPSVVSDSGGLQEAVVAGKTGVVAKEGDPQSTALAILEMLQDEEKRRAMGQLARERAEQELTWKRCAARYAEILQDLVVLKPGTEN